MVVRFPTKFRRVAVRWIWYKIGHSTNSVTANLRKILVQSSWLRDMVKSWFFFLPWKSMKLMVVSCKDSDWYHKFFDGNVDSKSQLDESGIRHIPYIYHWCHIPFHGYPVCHEHFYIYIYSFTYLCILYIYDYIMHTIYIYIMIICIYIYNY